MKGKMLAIGIFFTLMSTMPFKVSAYSDHFEKEIVANALAFTEEIRKARQSYLREEARFRRDYISSVNKAWRDYKRSSMFVWVQYSRDLSVRSILDFKEGKLRIESLSRKRGRAGQQEAVQYMKQHLKRMIGNLNRAAKKKIISISDLGNPTSPKKALRLRNLSNVVNRKLQENPPVRLIGEDGKERWKYAVSLSFMPDYLQKRAKKYGKLVSRFCRKYKVKLSVAMAVIQAESAFNPMAYNSRGPAYGLMQIVPRYAGKLMNKLIFKVNKKPTTRELYNVEKNIEMGVGYLGYLYHKKWAGINDSTKRWLCVVSNYNGGPSSVYTAVAGWLRLGGARKHRSVVKMVNRVSLPKLFSMLVSSAPKEETRKYVDYVSRLAERFSLASRVAGQ